jgi:hypothetical protein
MGASFQIAPMMNLNGFLQVFAGGMSGVVVVELLQFASWRNTGKLGQNYRSPEYWGMTAVLVIVSGFITVVYGTEQVPMMKAMQLGVGAPALFAGFASAKTGRARKGKAGFVGLRQDGPPSPWRRLLEMRAW